MSRKFFLKEILAACLVSLIFLSFGLAGWISGAVTIFFFALYIAYFILSYWLARGDPAPKPGAFFSIKEEQETIENIDIEEEGLKFRQPSDEKVNQIGNELVLERNSITPNIMYQFF